VPQSKEESGFTANYQGQGQSRNQRIGVSRAKTQGRKEKRNIVLNLAFLAGWRE